MPYPGGKHGPGHYLGGGGGAGGVIVLPNGATVTPGTVVSAENEAGTTQVPGVGGIGDIAYVYGNVNYSLQALHPTWGLVFGLGTPFQWMRKVLTGTAADNVFLSAGVQRVVIAGMFALSGAVGAFAGWTGSASLGNFGLTGSYNLQNIFLPGPRIGLIGSARTLASLSVQTVPGSTPQYSRINGGQVQGDNGFGGNASLLIVAGVAFSATGADIPAGDWGASPSVVNIEGFSRAHQSPQV